MATIIGSLRGDATNGEKIVLDWLRTLPDDVIVWPELIVGDTYPDFVVLHPRLGLAVIEVKDWVDLDDVSHDSVTVITRGQQRRVETNPVQATRRKAFTIVNKLQAERQLLHDFGPHEGKLKLPYVYAVIFPNLTRMFLFRYNEVLGDYNICCRDDLEQRPAVEVVAGMDWLFQPSLTAADVDAIRRVLHPELSIKANGRPVGTADIAQEQAAKEGLFDTAAPPDAVDLPEHGQRLAVNPSVRLIRGVVGSGKTLVLVMRAKYLAAAHPDWRVLVVTFNRPLTEDLAWRFDGYEDRVTVTSFHSFCRGLLDGINEWGSGPVDDELGRIAHILNQYEGIPRFDAPFLVEEICWLKEMGLTDKARYLSEPRIGRGTPLSPADREFVWTVYQSYRTQLDIFRRYDWADVPLMVLRAMQHKLLPSGQYDAILVDEAQDFAPVWFDVLRRQLKPQTAVMFLSADGVQRIYRRHSWRAMGLNVVGRTRILNRSYRSTYEIARAAQHLLQSDEAIRRALEAEDEDLPPADLDPGWMRHGDAPQLGYFPNPVKERNWVINRVRELLRDGYAPQDIAIFHYTRAGRESVEEALRAAGLPVRPLTEAGSGARGVAVGTMHAAKGLEFPVVFISQLDALFMSGPTPTTREEMARERAEKLRLLYVAMTRAREKLYLCHQGTLPAHLNAFAQHLRDQPRAA